MSKTKTAAMARQPSVEERALASLPPLTAPEHGFKTRWQGGNPFERLELVPKMEKVRSR